MILDLEKFIAEGRQGWRELEALLDRLDRDPALRLGLEEVKRFHQLYQRASADLARLGELAAEPELRLYLESLVARAFGEVHESRRRPHRFAPLRWFAGTFPRVFRRHIRAFQLAVAMTLLGGAIGAGLLTLESDAKEVLLPFEHLLQDPSERVAKEEAAGVKELSGEKGRLEGRKMTFSSYLMTHNTRVSILCLAMGVTFGLGTLVLLFYNGVILGAVVFDYLRAGEGAFLAGWLLPHGSVEIPAVLLAGQAGLVLAGAMIGRGEGIALRGRLRRIGPDLVTLIGGAALLLVWAGFVESFVSQHHQPVLPYGLKIGFGAGQLLLLALFLARAGRGGEIPEEAAHGR